jgi:hypothetical protein
VASEPETQETKEESREGVLTGIALIGGLGITMMVLAAGIGVVLPDADSAFAGLITLIGLGLLVTSIGGWVILVRPYENFDDISIPLDEGHHHGEEEEH